MRFLAIIGETGQSVSVDYADVAPAICAESVHPLSLA
jgi:hypothetical protein